MGRDGDAYFDDDMPTGTDGAAPVGAAEPTERWTRPPQHRRVREPRQVRKLEREIEELRGRVSQLQHENAQLKRMVANEQLRILALRSLAKGHW
jgi:predicted RNase H-like nuclease (RuvC/YqgF family)